jgi:signal transduction histidine kinase
MFAAIPDKVKGYIYKAVLLVVCVLLVWANFKILDAKNDRITTLGNEVTAVTKKYEDAKAELAKKAKSDAVTVEVKAIVKDEEVKVEKAKTEARVYVEKKVAAIEEKYKVLEPTPDNEGRKAVEISLERSKGLWLSYCLQEPQDQACPN